MKNNLESLAQVCTIINTAYKLRANGDIRSIKALSRMLSQEELTAHFECEDDDNFGERLGDLIETFFEEFMDRSSRDFLEDQTIKTSNGK